MAGTSPTKVWFPAINTLTCSDSMCLHTSSTACMLMITLSTDFCNPISQRFYDNLISGLQFHQLSCPCGHSGCLNIHGYYSRNVKSGGSSLRLRICRVRCSLCGSTHALIPASLVPYSQIPLAEQVRLISAFEQGTSQLSVMEQNPSIDENNVSSILRRFRLHWRQRLLAERIPLLPLHQLVRRCFQAFHRQFMQIKSTSNLLFLNTT